MCELAKDEFIRMKKDLKSKLLTAKELDSPMIVMMFRFLTMIDYRLVDWYKDGGKFSSKQC